MASLGREAQAQNDELQEAGRPLLGCFEAGACTRPLFIST
jgi:hypothetical protein